MLIRIRGVIPDFCPVMSGADLFCFYLHLCCLRSLLLFIFSLYP